MYVQNVRVNRITLSRFHLNKIKDGGGRHFEYHQNVISTTCIERLSSNSVRWCRTTPCSRKRGQNHHFCKNKMAAAAILDFGKIAITSPRID